MKLSEKTYVILVNWRNPYDTIECIESLLNQSYQDCQIVVCENGSADDSTEIFKAWASGNLCIAPYGNSPGASYAQQSHDRKRPDAEFAQAEKVDEAYTVPSPTSVQIKSKILFIEIPDNTGFAGGNNVGLRYALANGDGQYFWILNNDTVVAPDALDHMIQKVKDNPKCAMVGATIYHYDDPSKIQYSCGAKANKWLATVKPIINYPTGNQDEFERAVERQISYVVGASMLVTREFLERVGLISEEYFLYYEEQDWVARMPKELKIGYSSLAWVFHKEGAATGGKTKSSTKKSITADYYATRSRILYTKTFFIKAIPFVLGTMVVGVFFRMKRWEPKNALAVIRGVLNGLRGC
jgi:GT2 family glycosyltransferase